MNDPSSPPLIAPRLTRAIEGCMILLFGAIIVVLSLSILARLVQAFLPPTMNVQLPWAEEFIKFALFWICFLGSAVLFGEAGGHMALGYLGRKLGHPRWFTLLNITLCAILALLLLIYGVRVSLSMWIERTPILQIRKAWVNMVVPLSALMTLYYLGLRFRALLRRDP